MTAITVAQAQSMLMLHVVDHALGTFSLACPRRVRVVIEEIR